MKRFSSIALLTCVASLTAAAVALAVAIPRQPGVVRSNKISKSQTLLTWRDRSDNETNFEIQRRRAGKLAWRTRGFTDVDVNEFVDGVRPNVVFIYRVRAINEGGLSPFSNECFVNRTPPSKPISVSATLIGLTKARIRWADRSAIETGFRIQRRELGKAFETIADVPAGTEEYLDETLAAATSYIYRVRALGQPNRCIKHSKYSQERMVSSKGGVRVLSITNGGTGRGFVRSVPAGINCGVLKASCAYEFPVGTTVRLIAKPGKNSRFKGWFGASVCSNSLDDCVVRMGQNRSISTKFKRIKAK